MRCSSMADDFHGLTPRRRGRQRAMRGRQDAQANGPQRTRPFRPPPPTRDKTRSTPAMNSGRSAGLRLDTKCRSTTSGGVFPHRPGIHEIVLDTRRTGHLDPRINSGRNRNPSSMTDRRHQLAGLGERANERSTWGSSANFIGHPAAWTDDSVKIARFHVGDRRVAGAGIAVLAAVQLCPPQARPP